MMLTIVMCMGKQFMQYWPVHNHQNMEKMATYSLECTFFLLFLCTSREKPKHPQKGDCLLNLEGSKKSNEI